MTSEADRKKGRIARLAEIYQRHKKRNFFLVLGFLYVLIQVFNNIQQISSFFWPVFTQSQRDHEAVTSLALGDAEASVTKGLGEPRQSLDLCAEIRTCGPDTSHKPVLNIYRHEDYTVRAVFDGNKLEFYAVTRESDKFKPHLKMPFDWGELGEFTYSQVSTSGITPDDLDAFHRRFPSYAEIKSLGAPNFQGIVLGYTPDGRGDERSWDAKAVQALDAALVPSNGPKQRVEAAEPFRAASKPNTQGIFNDDGFVGNLLHNARNARQIISVGAER